MTIKTWEDQYQAKCAELEIAQGTLKNLWARVAELEAELATAKRGIECYEMQLAKDTVQSDIDRIMAQGVEIAQLKAELAAGRNQQTIGYLEKHLIESGRKIQLCNLTKTRLWADSVPVYLAAGAQPRCPHCDGTGDVHSIDGEWRGVCDCGAGAQPVPEGMALVPIEISEAMYEAYHKADNAAWCQMGASHGASIGDIWDAMLAAAKEQK